MFIFGLFVCREAKMSPSEMISASTSLMTASSNSLNHGHNHNHHSHVSIKSMCNYPGHPNSGTGVATSESPLGTTGAGIGIGGVTRGSAATADQNPAVLYSAAAAAAYHHFSAGCHGYENSLLPLTTTVSHA